MPIDMTQVYKERVLELEKENAKCREGSAIWITNNRDIKMYKRLIRDSPENQTKPLNIADISHLR